jgi:hypothetical protein
MFCHILCHAMKGKDGRDRQGISGHPCHRYSVAVKYLSHYGDCKTFDVIPSVSHLMLWIWITNWRILSSKKMWLSRILAYANNNHSNKTVDIKFNEHYSFLTWPSSGRLKVKRQIVNLYLLNCAVGYEFPSKDTKFNRTKYKEHQWMFS